VFLYPGVLYDYRGSCWSRAILNLKPTVSTSGRSPIISQSSLSIDGSLFGELIIEFEFDF